MITEAIIEQLIGKHFLPMVNTELYFPVAGCHSEQL